MSVKLSCKEMEKLLAVPKGKRDLKWAHNVCTASRFIHLDVWRFCAERKFVEDTVIPLLGRARKEILYLLKNHNLKEAEKNKIAQYLENDEDRIKNIKENYLRGKPSAFRPEHKLSEPESKVG